MPADYTDEEFKEIADQKLIEEEGITEELAITITEQVMEKLNTKDLRDCIEVARSLLIFASLIIHPSIRCK